MYTVNKEIKLKRAERVHLGVDELNYGMSGGRVFWEAHHKRWKTNSSHWADLRDGLRKRVLSVLPQRRLFPHFLFCLFSPHQKKVVTDRATAEWIAGSLTLNFYLLFCSQPEWRVIFFYLTPIQINFHSGKLRLYLFPFGTKVTLPICRLPFFFFFFSFSRPLPPWLITQRYSGVPINFPPDRQRSSCLAIDNTELKSCFKACSNNFRSCFFSPHSRFPIPW